MLPSRPERVGLPLGPAFGRATPTGRSRPRDLTELHLPVDSQRSVYILPPNGSGITKIPRPNPPAGAPSLPSTPLAKRTVATTVYPPDDSSSDSTPLVEMVSHSGDRLDNGNRALSQDSKAAGKEDLSDGKSDTASVQGYGQSLWERVRAAAGSLTINVAWAWETNTPTASGEVTPPGQESHLLSVIKSYHLGKARDPADLPGWLFDEHERWTISRSRLSDLSGPTRSSRSPALQALYNAVAEEQKIDLAQRTSSENARKNPAIRSKAADRLRDFESSERGRYKVSRQADLLVAGNVDNERE